MSRRWTRVCHMQLREFPMFVCQSQSLVASCATNKTFDAFQS